MDVLESSKKYYLDVSLEEAETSIRASLKDAARSVIAVGHYLKVIRDKELYREAGYENVWNYAADTFGFSKSTASRYMARNDKFSVGGNSPILAEEFREYSKAQLQEMLSLDSEQLENVTPDMTVKQIRELKKPKELPYFEIDGQMEIQDILKADQEGQKKDPETEEKLSAYGLPKRVYPDGVTRKIEGCEGDTGKGYNCLECHLECELGEEYCMCVDATGRLPLPCEMVRTGRWEDLKEHVGKSCQFVNLDLVKYEYGSVVPVPCCKKCQNPCAFACTVSGKRVAASQQPAAADAPQETTGTAAEKQPEENVATSQQNAKQDSPTIREFIKSWKEILPEEFRRAMRAMREGNSTKEKAQQIQKELSPYGAHCYGCSEYSFSWHSFAKGMDWEVDGKKIHLTYARLASELLCMYDPQLNQFDEKPNIDDEHEEPAEISAEQQQEHEEKPKTGKCIHDGISRCTLSEEDKEKDGTGEDCAHHCCWNCVKRDGCNIECYASSKRKTLDDEAAAEDEENAEQPAEPIEFDRKTLEDMIRNAQEVLDQMCDYWVENQPYTYAKYNMMIQAYKLLLKEHDESDQKLDPVEQQPELPLLKNDKQRAEFIDAYEEWPLWIDNQETGEKYYRYEFPDGTSFVIKTYHAMLYNYDALEYGNYKEGYGENEQYLLKPGKFFRDCRTNRSTLIEKLKELQKNM
ncbi:hypothetical protein WMO21_02370 [Lachnospiraceae bacterium CLA-AA-H58]|uniref:hypothetical protein n=1 Tax=Pilosibacter fragilis TaxID=3078042 RepID=UPI0032D3D40B